eukprot:m.33763 g.33763  ORF g.33763 m.33763 type:complete len:486 (+) comp16867_c1_seq1:93-1550(+)
MALTHGFFAMAMLGMVQAQCVDIINGGFEQDGLLPGQFTKQCPSGWNCNIDSNVGIVSQRAGAWGGLSSNSGAHFITIQRTGTTVKQTLTLEKGSQYTISFLSADRPGYGNDETFGVSIGGRPVFKTMHPFPQFFSHKAKFTAEATSEELEFSNTSPDGDKSIFLDDIKVCKMPPMCQELTNGDFELDENLTLKLDSYAVETTPQNWTSNGRIHIVRQYTGAWGNLNSGSGAFYVSIQYGGSKIMQTITGLTPGSQYTLKYLAAERPGYGTAERVKVTVSTGSATVSDVVNPYAQFVEHELTFLADAGPAQVMFENTQTTPGDMAVFVDDIRICEMPATSTTATTTFPLTMTTTTTATTHTIIAQNFIDVKAQIQNLIVAQEEFAKAQKNFQTMQAEISTQQVVATEIRTVLLNRVDAITTALADAVKGLPPAKDRTQCTDATCQPLVVADGTRLTIQAETIQLQSTCGVIDPCTLLEALNALRQ